SSMLRSAFCRVAWVRTVMGILLDARRGPRTARARAAGTSGDPGARRRNTLAAARQSENGARGGPLPANFFSAARLRPFSSGPPLPRRRTDSERAREPVPGRVAGRCRLAAGALRRITRPGGGADRPAARRPDPPADRPGPRGLPEDGARPRPRLAGAAAFLR